MTSLGVFNQLRNNIDIKKGGISVDEISVLPSAPLLLTFFLEASFRAQFFFSKGFPCNSARCS